MKRMIATIIVLLIIFVGMVVYRYSEQKSEITIDEVNSIEEYIKKVYGWKELTGQALPEFDNINNANEQWIWGTLRKNIDEEEVDNETINSVAKQLYGNEFNRQCPKEGLEFISYEEETQKYKLKEVTLDAVNDSFLLNKIEKNKQVYNVEIVEYLVDYTNEDNENEIENDSEKENTNGKVKVKNINDETIYELTEEQATDGNIKKIVKENINKFSKKKVTIEKGENLVIKKVEKE